LVLLFLDERDEVNGLSDGTLVMMRGKGKKRMGRGEGSRINRRVDEKLSSSDGEMLQAPGRQGRSN